jgi:hypothetical protein
VGLLRLSLLFLDTMAALLVTYVSTSESGGVGEGQRG